VQWCHGAPGLIPVLTKAYQLLDDSSPECAASSEQILAAARKAADVVWEHGLLTKVNDSVLLSACSQRCYFCAVAGQACILPSS